MLTRSGAVVFLLAILAMPMSGRPALTELPKERYVFVENTDRWVGIWQGEWELIGKLDRHGDFIQEEKHKKGAPLTLAPPYAIINFPGLKPKKMYEFRSGVLIPGEIQPDGRFVPEVGGKIIAFKDYEYTPTATPIWNLPGGFVTEEQAEKLKKMKEADKK